MSRFRPVMALPVVVAAALVVVAGCGAKDNDRIPAAATLTIDTATTSGPTSLVPAGNDNAPAIGSVSGSAGGDSSAVGDDGTLHGVGEAVTTANGNTVKLRAVDPSGAGPSRYATDVEICASTAARVAPSQFTLELANGSSVPSVADGQQPALAVGDVSAGSCAGGWVTFQLPPDQGAVALVFRGSSVIRWSLA